MYERIRIEIQQNADGTIEVRHEGRLTDPNGWDIVPGPDQTFPDAKAVLQHYGIGEEQ